MTLSQILLVSSLVSSLVFTQSTEINEDFGFHPCVFDRKSATIECNEDTSFNMPVVSSNTEIKSLIIKGTINNCPESAVANIKSKQLNVTIKNFVPYEIHETCFVRKDGIFSLTLESEQEHELDITVKKLFSLFSNVRHLHLKRIHLRELPAKFMAKMKEIESLTFTGNNLRIIRDHAFRHQFATLNSIAFYDLPTLNNLLQNSGQWTSELPNSVKKLVFSCMNDQEYPVAPLRVNIPIESLTLSNCDIEDLETDRFPSISFRSLMLKIKASSLSQVNLDGNQFGSSNNFLSVLRTFTQLKSFSLRYNKGKLTSVNIDKKLELLDLTGSHLNSNGSEFLPPVKTLVLTEAKIYSLEANALKGKGVDKLVLQYIPQFPRLKVADKPGTWGTLLKEAAPTLRELDLSGNSLKLDENLELPSLVNLKTLLLENNLIAKFPGHLIQDLKKLMFLDLAENKLTELGHLAKQNTLMMGNNDFAERRGLTINLTKNPLRILARCHLVNELPITLEDFMKYHTVHLNASIPCDCRNAWISDISNYQYIQCTENSNKESLMAYKLSECSSYNGVLPCVSSTAPQNDDNSIAMRALNVEIIKFDKKSDTLTFVLKPFEDVIYEVPGSRKKEIQLVKKKIKEAYNHEINHVVALWKVGQVSATLKLRESKKKDAQLEFRLEHFHSGAKEGVYVIAYFENESSIKMADFYEDEIRKFGSKNGNLFWLMLGCILFGMFALLAGGVILALWLSRKMKKQKDLIMNSRLSGSSGTFGCNCRRVDCKICSEKQRQSLLDKNYYSTASVLKTNSFMDDEPLPSKATPDIRRNTWARKTFGFFTSKSNKELSPVPKDDYPLNGELKNPQNNFSRTRPMPPLPLPKINSTKDAISDSSSDDLYYGIH